MHVNHKDTTVLAKISARLYRHRLQVQVSTLQLAIKGLPAVYHFSTGLLQAEIHLAVNLFEALTLPVKRTDFPQQTATAPRGQREVSTSYSSQEQERQLSLQTAG